MRNASSVSSDAGQRSRPLSIRDEEDDGWDAEVSHGVESGMEPLLEENARLRALVVQMSDLVLRNVVDQK